MLNLPIRPTHLALALLLSAACARGQEVFSLSQVDLVIPQVDYEGAVHLSAEDSLPHLDFDEVRWDRVVDRHHAAVVLRSSYLEVTLLPQMGRVYSMVYGPTGHETLWHNDVVRPGGANNRTGWWLWIGGIEYTLPGEEHGYTWALSWDWEILEDSAQRKAVRASVVEPTTGLKERIDFGLRPGSAALEVDIRIWNPTADTVWFAHWVNPMWVPGGRNELTDGTRFVIPTRQISVADRWQPNLGPSPQDWASNPLKQIRNWAGMGDLMAEGLTAGFYGAYAPEEDEGVVRVFDPLASPGVDVWTYGYHPDDIPMGSGAPNRGYVEMWGGTVRHFPNERDLLAPGASLSWSEWVYPFHGTGGLSGATPVTAANAVLAEGGRELHLGLCPTRVLDRAEVEVRHAGRTVARSPLQASPPRPFRNTLQLPEPAEAADMLVIFSDAGAEIARLRPETAESRGQVHE